MPRRIPRVLSWLAFGLAGLLALPVLALLASLVFGWNWARAPLQDWALRQTGRVLYIAGDLELQLAWPAPRILASGLSFANPAWSATPQMVTAERVDITLDVPALIQGRLAFPELHLTRPQVFLEQAAGGRKNWLLDRAQTDEAERFFIGRVVPEDGQLHYIDAAEKTAVVVDISTLSGPAARPVAAAASSATAASAPTAAALPDGVRFAVRGQFRGQTVQAEGRGGAVLAWRDESRPYALQVRGTMGATRVQAAGTVTGLQRLAALDLQVEVSGEDLADLYTLTGIALPPTPTYRSAGRLWHAGALWRYGPFVGQVGRSDLAGSLQVQTGAARPVLSGAVTSRQLDLADLGPAVGKRAQPGTRVLPDLPLDTSRWAHMDADVNVQAQSLLRDRARLVEGLQMRLQLQDRQLRLDPLGFRIAGGQWLSKMSFDARSSPLQGQATGTLRGLALGRLLSAVDVKGADLGRLDGDIALRGRGSSIGQMLASADGHLRLRSGPGRVSRLLMEQTGLHLLEILRLNLTGDQTVAVNCAVLDFKVAQGVMQGETLVLDTEINTLAGSGQIDLRQEQLNLRVVPRTKVTSIVALRSPIDITGTLGQPRVALDTASLAARGLGALVLGLVNPLLALVPLVETGPGVQGGCGEKAIEAKSPPAR